MSAIAKDSRASLIPCLRYRDAPAAIEWQPKRCRCRPVAGPRRCRRSRRSTAWSSRHCRGRPEPCVSSGAPKRFSRNSGDDCPSSVGAITNPLEKDDRCAGWRSRIAESAGQSEFLLGIPRVIRRIEPAGSTSHCLFSSAFCLETVLNLALVGRARRPVSQHSSQLCHRSRRQGGPRFYSITLAEKCHRVLDSATRH